MNKKELQEYRELILEFEMLEEKILRLKTEICSPRNQILHDGPRTGNVIGIADKVVRLVELKTECEKQLNRTIDARMDVENAIQRLNSPLERTVISYRYIMGMDWVEISKKLKYSEPHIFRVHNKALKNMRVYESRKCDTV